MAHRFIRQLALAPLAALLLAPLASAQTQQATPPQSPADPAQDAVAEAARKAKAEKGAKAKKVFTDEDLPSLKDGGLSVVGDQPPADAPADGEKAPAKPASPAVAGKEAAKDPKSEAYWRERAGKIHSQMNDVDQQIATLQDEMKKGGNLAVDPKSGLNQNVIYFEDRSAKLKALEKKKAELQAQMDALEEEARRADVPIGWLR